jgi:hypothetical protein
MNSIVPIQIRISTFSSRQGMEVRGPCGRSFDHRKTVRFALRLREFSDTYGFPCPPTPRGDPFEGKQPLAIVHGIGHGMRSP